MLLTLEHRMIKCIRQKSGKLAMTRFSLEKVSILSSQLIAPVVAQRLRAGSWSQDNHRYGAMAHKWPGPQEAPCGLCNSNIVNSNIVNDLLESLSLLTYSHVGAENHAGHMEQKPRGTLSPQRQRGSVEMGGCRGVRANA